MWVRVTSRPNSLGVCQGSGISGRSGQYGGERHLGTGRSSRFGLQQSAVSSAEGINGLANHDQLAESEWLQHHDQVQDGDSLFGVSINQKGRLCVFDRPQGHPLPDTRSSRLSTLSLDHAQRKGQPVQSSMRWLFYSSPVLHQSVCPDYGMGSQERELTFVLSGQMVGDCRVSSSLAPTLSATLSALRGPGCCHQHGKVRPRAFQ